MAYEPVIGLEVHVQLKTVSKMFCGCATGFGGAPNSHTCPVCLGFPGALPVLNQRALTGSIRVAVAVGCKISDKITFHRKNYFYPDLPKDYQISQYDEPLSEHGHLKIKISGGEKTIRIKRVHMEEDAGKLIHEEGGDSSFVDFNRSGMPLLEIVSEPDINSPEEAYRYLTDLKLLLRYLDVSDCDMEKGSLRCDANISIRKKGETGLGTKAEVKNMNSFKAVKSALEFEFERQVKRLETGERIVQETRLWDPDREITVSMRSKEEAHDYRYFPEPDLVPFMLQNDLIEMERKNLPELPGARKARFASAFGLPEYDAEVLTQEKETADYFEECLGFYDKPKIISNWLMGDVSGYLNAKNLSVRNSKLRPQGLAGLLKEVDSGKISGKMAKDIIIEMLDTGEDAGVIISEKGLAQISDSGELDKVSEEVIAENRKTAEDFLKGKDNALMFLVGQVMKRTKGKANPAVVNRILRDKLTKKQGEEDA
ncbi:MAG: aspartyl/glutamyl-tRNA amidotransferase subunit B [Omnitrophica WOR_2 bacterium RIFCSPLOWO2_12_FULL_51_24]|nr:MAG: aspartyl/glutamyl-tRNA amidotransferase subunit B [Omnitrophica WOR_2 bacterium RIFCSPLOWO2_12_FULL_51_24]